MMHSVPKEKRKKLRLIDADVVYKVLTDYYHHKTDIQHDALKAALSKVPTVDANPVKYGKWLWLDGVRCSICNYKLQTTGLMSYCPHCGARM